MFFPLDVLYVATTPEYQAGYDICEKEHCEVSIFHTQTSFQLQVELFLRFAQAHVMFLCDDDIVTRPFVDSPHPIRILNSQSDALCVSLRLGTNTVTCYPLKRKQKNPVLKAAIDDARYWHWTIADGDNGYPGSLDGHVFRRDMLRVMLSDSQYTNPNELEDVLSQSCQKLKRTFPLMASYTNSLITGNPVNLVNTTHQNRHGELHPRSLLSLNGQYLAGRRLNLGTFSRKQITGAHTELALEFA